MANPLFIEGFVFFIKAPQQGDWGAILNFFQKSCLYKNNRYLCAIILN
jgi:hypothetical protein